MSILGEDELPAHQLELVREAIAREPLALVVEPADPTDTQMAEALEKARAAGIPVILVNRPLAGTDSKQAATKPNHAATKKESGDSKGTVTPGAHDNSTSQEARPFVLVAPPSFTQSARQLVASAIRNAMNAKLDPKGGAVIVINTVGDPFIHERTTAIRKCPQGQRSFYDRGDHLFEVIRGRGQIAQREAQGQSQARPGLRGRRAFHLGLPIGDGRADSRSSVRSGCVPGRVKLFRHDPGWRLRGGGWFHPEPGHPEGDRDRREPVPGQGCAQPG